MCWDVNITVKNNGTAARRKVVVPVRFDPPRTAFPPVKAWYKGRTGTPRKLTPDGRLWEVEIDIDLPPGQSIHVGWDFEGSVPFEADGYRLLAMTPGTPDLKLGALALAVEPGETPASDLVLAAANPRGAPSAIVVRRLAIAASPSRLALDQLIEGDARLEGLAWIELLDGAPVPLAPGAPPLRFPIPAEALIGMRAGLAIADITDADGQAGVEAFYQGPAGGYRTRAAAARTRTILADDGPSPTPHTRPRERRDDGAARGDDSCCLTAIRFKKLYPGDMTVTVTAGDGRRVRRTFTATKTERTAFMKAHPNDDDDGSEVGVIPGGLGECVDVDVEIADTTSPTLQPVHYHFELCCKDRKVRNGARLVYQSKPTGPLDQVVKLPLLTITGVQRAPCP